MSNDLLRRLVSDGLSVVVSWTCSMGRWEVGHRLSAMKNVYFIVPRLKDGGGNCLTKSF